MGEKLLNAVFAIGIIVLILGLRYIVKKVCKKLLAKLEEKSVQKKI
ncbi:MAG: hypothetical protein ACI4MH_01840 [Candidatus Coproplasma sp.]